MSSLHSVINRAIPGPDVYIWALQSAYSMGERLYETSFALGQDPAIDEKIRRDPIILGAMNDRRAAIAGRDWTLEPASDSPKDKAAAKVMEALIRHMTNFRMGRLHLADAVFRARSYAEVQGERRYIQLPPEIPEIIEMWWVPTHLKDIDPRRIRWGFDHHISPSNPTPRLEIWSLEEYRWIEVTRKQALVSVTYDDVEATLGYGRGLREAIYHYYWAKGTAMREGLQAIERWAQGWFVAKIDGDIVGDDKTTPEEAKAAMLRVLNAHRSRHGGVIIDSKDDIETHFPSGTGSKIVIDFVQMLDDAITRLITGSLHPAGGGSSGGSLARAEVEQDTSERIVALDREVLDEAITEDLIKLLWYVNRENFVRLGLADADMPRFATVHQPVENPSENANVISLALNNGIPLRKDEVYRKLGFTQPDEHDEVIESVMGLPGLEEGLPALPFARRRSGLMVPRHHLKAKEDHTGSPEERAERYVGRGTEWEFEDATRTQ